jgi:hypothetical protein
MKSNCLKFLIMLGFLIPVALIEANGQTTGIKGYSLKISPGALAYYGDLSTNDFNIFDKLAKGSKFGASVAVIKQFRPFFGVQAQFFTGSLYTAATNNTYFAGSLAELSLSARLDPLKLFKLRSQKFSPYLSAGVAAFSFRSVRREQGTNLVLLPNFGYQIDGVTNSGIKTAMSMPLAIGFSYRILPFLKIELEHSVRLTNTDLLDCYKGPVKINDMFSHTSIGLRFSIPDKSESDAYKRVPVMNIPMEPVIKPADTVKTEIKDFNIFIDVQMPDNIVAGQTVDIKLRINKGKYTGPAKLIQKFPAGFTEAADLVRSTAFSFTNQNLIIDWEKMPEEAVINYSYQIKILDNVSGSQMILGKFEYKAPEGTGPLVFNKSVFIEKKKPTDENVLVAENRKTISSLGNIKPSQPKEGIEFRVQCGAYRENSKADIDLASKHNVTELIQEEFIDGWYKYTVGSFRTYDETAKYRDSFIARTGILSSFIVAYKDGRRLTKITEAFK